MQRITSQNAISVYFHLVASHASQVYHNGFHGDTSTTYMVGDVDTEGQVLVQVARECRDEGVRVCGPGDPLSNIGAAIL